MSIDDDDAPIKVQKLIDKSSKILSEDEDVDSDLGEKDDNLTEFEKWQEEEQKKSKTKRSKARHSILDNQSSTYQRTRKQNSVDGLWRNMSDLKQTVSSPRTLSSISSVLKEEDFDIGEYLDTQIKKNATMTNQLQSTLSKFDSTHGKPANKSVLISENNSSDEEDDNV
jgi:adenine-specific DNA glycosylase